MRAPARHGAGAHNGAGGSTKHNGSASNAAGLLATTEVVVVTFMNWACNEDWGTGFSMKRWKRFASSLVSVLPVAFAT